MQRVGGWSKKGGLWGAGWGIWDAGWGTWGWHSRGQPPALSPTGPEIPLASYPAPPPAPFPVDPKAGPMPPQPGFAPMAMYPPTGPAAQYPLYPSGPPVYNPTGEHWVPLKSTTAFWGGPHRPPPFSLRSTTTLRPRTAQLSRCLSPPGDSCLNGDTHRGHSGGGVLLSPPWGRNSAL